MLNNVKRAARQNINSQIVVSSAIGAGLLGLVTYVAVKSGIKPVADAAKIAKNGGKK